MGERSCGPSRSACPHSSTFCLRSAFLYSTTFISRSHTLPPFLFHVPMLLQLTLKFLTTGPYLTTADGHSCFTECVWEGGALCPLISSQEHKFSFPILLRSMLLRSYIQFAFLRACVNKMPGTRERETRNARPSLDRPMKYSLPLTKLTNISSEWKVGCFCRLKKCVLSINYF